MVSKKKILKDANKHIVPKSIISRRKAGFGMPLRSIFSNEKRIDSLLDKEFLFSLDFFSIDDVNKIIKSHLNGNEDNSSIIYSIICFQEWYKMFIMKEIEV